MSKKMLTMLVLSLPFVSAAYAADQHTGRMETCLKAALAKHPGEILSLEAEIENGKPIYEFDIKSKDGKEWEIECSAKTGKLTEEEQEVADANDPTFKSNAKVGIDDAKKTALAKRAGEVIETEYSLEADGTPSYEFDIKAADGKEWEVEVDAVSGKILEEEEEIYQIGKD